MTRAYLAALAVCACTLTPVPASADAWDTVYTCRFPSHGTVVIDTRSASRSITVNGQRYPAQTGSYFFQETGASAGTDRDPLVVFFNPTLVEWTFQGETTSDCDATAE